jgi:hypothetical protein
MLGHHPLLARQLRKNGRRAFATVLDSKRTIYNETAGNASLVSNTTVLWKFVLRVEPEGEPPFEAKVDALMPQMWSPTAGARFPVLYDPGDHGKVVVDHSDEGEELLEQDMSRERTAARAARWRAAGQDEMADRYERIHDPALGLFDYRTLSRNPDERKRQLAERRAKVAEIMSGPGPAGGPSLVVNGQAVQLGGAPSAAATADALTKLADLRDRGALTEDEFQAQKKKLLGE